MKISILHYHLRPGGVSTVIRNTQRALARKFDVEVLANVGYNDKPARSRSAFIAESRALAKRLRAALKGTDVLHAHNPILGKNPRLTFALKLLALETPLRIISQVHDFPEEKRPAQLHALRFCTGRRDDEFFRAMCYFDAPNLVWATLKTADARKLAERGVTSKKIFVLPNPIDDEFFGQPAPADAELQKVSRKLADYARAHRFGFDPRRKLLLSPMKVMVRKNNAEAIDLVSRLGDCQLLISLDASSPRDRAYSERLKRKIRRERSPVVIGFGEELKNPLPLFHLAHAILTTSTQEGFGYAFLEGWLCNKQVIGRSIPEVTRDFSAEGMDLRHLYTNLDALAVNGIKRMLANPPQELIAHNRKVVLEKYSLAAYARRYESLLNESGIVGRGLGRGQ